MTLVNFKNGNRNALVNPLFKDVFNPFFNEAFSNAPQYNKVPAVNIAETEKGFAIELAVPGLKKEDFKINLDKNVLSVSAEVKAEEATETKKYNNKEFSYYSFKRSFNLPETVDQSSIDAQYVDGVLTLSVAKKEEARLQTREIAVK
ncbi:Hsp20/alpha crystallin family protein [Mucilaginibacter robiniae]|uniref:Hsp20/alpha crystallin family protein n=1 Tax=Mucilaginibacter robiniae TaxID=2728022 RepID=A0A7L5E3D0_9SPHI|nr:Hsp20/alpha crystallin family protein [Mucilaginibacter robiniae]QJD97870.1 Hsp20/alpha crystallin family protein [Mucilaginibacter robiniae]